MKRLKIEKIEKINKQLVDIEFKIYQRAKEENKIALKKLLEKQNDMIDYELEANITFISKEHELCTVNENFKPHFNRENFHVNINDKENHNVTTATIKNKQLNEQHHCWLLHSLYDDCMISWNKILKITDVCFDIEVSYQYISEIKL